MEEYKPSVPGKQSSTAVTALLALGSSPDHGYAAPTRRECMPGTGLKCHPSSSHTVQGMTSTSEIFLT